MLRIIYNQKNWIIQKVSRPDNGETIRYQVFHREEIGDSRSAHIFERLCDAKTFVDTVDHI